MSSTVTGPATIGSTTVRTGAAFLTAISALLSDLDEAPLATHLGRAKTSAVAQTAIVKIYRATLADALVMLARGVVATRLGATTPVIAKVYPAPARTDAARETQRSAAQAAASQPAIHHAEAVLAERNPAAARAVVRAHPAHAAEVVAAGVAEDDDHTRFRRPVHEEHL